MSDADKKSMYFVQDGFPLDDICGVNGCSDKAIGIFLAFDADTNEECGALNFCDSHAAQLATGYYSPQRQLRKGESDE